MTANRFAAHAMIILFTLPPLATADVAKGKALHDANCANQCHTKMTGGDGSVLYTRKDRRVQSLSQLAAQVRRCESSLGLKWFPEDVDSVVEYLNTTYYKFPAS